VGGGEAEGFGVVDRLDLLEADEAAVGAVQQIESVIAHKSPRLPYATNRKAPRHCHERRRNGLNEIKERTGAAEKEAGLSARSPFACGSIGAAMLAEALAHLLARRAPLGRGQGAVMVGVGAVEAGERALAHLLAGDEALLAEHPAAAHAGAAHAGAAGAVGAARRRRTHFRTARAAGAVRASGGRAHPHHPAMVTAAG